MNLHLERVLAAFKMITPQGNGWKALCPAHDDHRPSLKIDLAADGKILLCCKSRGCSAEEIVHAAKLTMEDLFPAEKVPPRIIPKKPGFPTVEEAISSCGYSSFGREPDQLWNYYDTHGALVGVVARWNQNGKKELRPFSRGDDSQWRMEVMPTPRPLYRLPQLAAQDLVVVTEGEKAADAAIQLGFVATTSASGSQAAHYTDWRPLAGKTVWICRDNDDPGLKYAESVATILHKIDPVTQIKIVLLPNLPPKGDLVDWVKAHPHVSNDELATQLKQIAEESEPFVGITPEESEVRSGLLPAKPFPVHCFPATVRDYIGDTAQQIGCDPSYIAVPLISALGSAIGNSRWLQINETFKAPPIIWSMIVGESGDGKSPAFRAVMKFTRQKNKQAYQQYEQQLKAQTEQQHYQRENDQEEMEEYRRKKDVYEKQERDHKQAHKMWETQYKKWDKEGQIGDAPSAPVWNEDPPQKPKQKRQLGPSVLPAVRYLITDTTLEGMTSILQDNPRGTIVVVDELASWFSSHTRYRGNGKSSDMKSYLSMYDGDEIDYYRKTGKEWVYIPRATVNVTGGIQPGILRAILTRENRDSGLAARFQFAWPERRAQLLQDYSFNPQLDKAMSSLFEKLFSLEMVRGEQGQLDPKFLMLEPKAFSLFQQQFNRLGEEHLELEGDLAAANAKHKSLPARLALILHMVRFAAGENVNPDMVDATSMQYAIELAEWFRNETLRVYYLLDHPDEVKVVSQLDQLSHWIRKHGGRVSIRDVQRKKNMKTAQEAEQLLNSMVEADKGNWEESVGTGVGRKPARHFVLNPPIATQEPVSSPEQSHDPPPTNPEIWMDHEEQMQQMKDTIGK